MATKKKTIREATPMMPPMPMDRVTIGRTRVVVEMVKLKKGVVGVTKGRLSQFRLKEKMAAGR